MNQRMTLARRRPPRIYRYVLFAAIFFTSCQGVEVDFSVRENSDVDTLVGELPIGNYVIKGTNEFFYVEQNRLKIAKKIDREKLDYGVINLVLQSTTSSELIDVSVTILDENDNDPYFVPSEVIVDISESSTIFSKFPLPIARDDDTSANGVSTNYHIVQGDISMFEIVTDELDFGDFSVSLKLKSPLNREEKDKYILRISATDDGHPQNTGYLDVVGRVTDVNDNPPVFSEKEYSAEISEDAELRSIVTLVHATDKDIGVNSEISYSISQATDTGVFGVNATTGEVYLLGKLDYESEKKYRLDIVATDHGQPPMYREASLTIHVTNTNDNPPKIQFLFIPKSASIANVNEDEEIGSLISFISLSDPDEESFSQPSPISLHLIQGNEKQKFKLEKNPNANFAKLLTNGEFSLDEEPSYNLTFKAEDNDTDVCHVTYASLPVTVNSANVHPPVFTQANQEFIVSELLCPGSIITTLEADDPDAGISGRMLYSITSGNEYGMFEIGKHSGLLSITSKLLYNINDNGTNVLKIRAKDETTAPLSAQTTVTVVIQDVNNYPPRFVEDSMILQVDENFIGVFGVIQTVDEDYGENAEVFYTIISAKAVEYSLNACSDCSYANLFAMKNESGEILTTVELDREYISKYEVIISATDKGETPLTSYAAIVVDIININDNSPIFRPAVYAVTVHQNQENIAQVFAEDLDGNEVEYQLLSAVQNEAQVGYFQISNTGLITRKMNFNIEINTYELTISAIDSGGKASKIPAIVYVNVVSQVPPQLASVKKKHFIMFQELHKGQVLGVITPTSGGNKFVKHNHNNIEIFEVVYSTGEVVVKDNYLLNHSLDFTTTTLEVSEVTEQNNFLSVVAQWLIVIEIRCENFKFPIFDNLSITATQISQHLWSDDVNITSEISQSVMKNELYNAHAENKDNIVYRLSSSFQGVSIDNNGTIVLLSNEFSNTHNLPPGIIEFLVVVNACNNKFPTLCSRLQLSVHLTLINPVSLHKQSHVFKTLFENQKQYSIVYDLSVDSYNQVCFAPYAENAINVTFQSFLGDEYFDIFPSGQVYLKQALNTKVKPNYEIPFTTNIAYSNGGYSYYSVLHFSIIDVATKIPEISDLPIQIIIKEGSQAFEILDKINITYYDSLENSQILFMFSETITFGENILTNFFAVDQYTGEIYSTIDVTRKNYQRLGLSTEPFSILLTILNLQTGQQVLNENITVFTEFKIEKGIRFKQDLYTGYLYDDSREISLFVNAFYFDFPWENGDVFYSISECENCPFQIDTISGEITVENEGMFEIVDEIYSFKVIGFSNRKTENEASANVKIFAIRNRIHFEKKRFTFNVSENALINAVVGKVEVKCKKCKGEIEYLLTQSNTGFVIDKYSGFITIQSQLDYELHQEFSLTVKAYNTEGKSVSTLVIINIINENDNKPIFDDVVLNLDEGIYGQSHIVGQIHANDLDTIEPLDYEIISVEPHVEADFSIDQQGNIYVTGKVDRELLTSNILQLKIRAFDAVEPKNIQFSTDQSFSVVVADQNDNPPYLCGAPAVIMKTGDAGDAVFDINTFDPDEGSNDDVSVEINTSRFDGDYFVLNSAKTTMKIREYLPDEKLVFNVEINVEDAGDPVLSSLKTLTVIKYIGDFTGGPQFDETSYTTTVSANSNVGKDILTISTNIQADFYLTKLADFSSKLKKVPCIFDLDKTTGKLKLVGNLNYPNIKKYSLEAVAVFKSDNRKISKVLITIHVTNLQSDILWTSPATQRVKISPNSPLDSNIASLSANYPDVTFSLDNVLPETSAFKIDSTTGQIHLAQSLENMKIAFYKLKVKIENLHGSTVTAEVLIDIEFDFKPLSQLPPKIKLFVSENVPPGYGVGCINKDGGTGITYSIIEDSRNGTFALNTFNGLVTLNTPTLDREELDFYSLIVAAKDQNETMRYMFQENDVPGIQSADLAITGPKPVPNRGVSFKPLITTGQTMEMQVFITVRDENDQVPVFKKNVARTMAVVSKVEATDGDIGRNGDIRYSLIGGNYNNVFWIDPYTGEIYTDTINKNEGEYELIITACDEAESVFQQKCSQTTVNQVVSTSLIEHSMVVSAPTKWYIEENTDNGVELFQVKILNLSVEERDSISYALDTTSLPCSILFNINEDTGSVFVNDNRMLNYEIINQCLISGSITVKENDMDYKMDFNSTIHIIDVNEFAPTFDRPLYNFEIESNFPVGEVIGQISAHDNDTGVNGIMLFLLEPTEYSYCFDVNTFSGKLYLTCKPKNMNEIELKVIITDKGHPALFNEAKVQISIQETKSNNPFIQPKYIHTSVYENESPVTLAKVTVSDGTEIRSVNVVYPVDNNIEYNDIEINSKGGSTEIVLLKQLDYEEINKYVLRVEAVNQDNPLQKAYAIITVMVEDLNDNKVIFETDNYQFYVSDDNIIGDAIGQVVANDDDAGTVWYESNAAGPFVVNPNTGDIIIQSDIEGFNEISFSLKASDLMDKNNIQNEATASVSIQKIKTGISYPRFTQYKYNGTVKEDEIKFAIVEMKTVDISEDPSKISYSLLGVGVQNFQIDENGKISNLNLLDREQNELYRFQVVATNTDDISIVARTFVEIFIEDVNDEFPVFTDLYKTSLMEDAPVGQFVLKVSAIDNDSTSIVRYALLNNGNNTFSIDEITGDIFVAGNIDRESLSSYTLQAEASDGNLLSHTSVTINIMDVNDEAPNFEKDAFVVSMFSSSKEGTTVMNITAVDADEGDNGKVFYRIINNNYYFDINNDGEIYLIRPLNCWHTLSLFEDCPLSISLEILATDGGYPNALSSTTNVEVIIVQDQTELINLLDENNVEVAILNTLKVKHKIYQMQQDIKRQIVYKILPGMDPDFFSCDESTGELFLSKSVGNLATGKVLNATLYAVESKFPYHAGIINILFEILSENIHRPTFDFTTYMTDIINENAVIGTSIITIIADDEDVGINGIVEYELTSGNIDSAFKINKKTGEIKTAKPLDYDTVQQYQLIVTAKDKATNSKQSNTTVIVNVRDLNDKVPSFMGMRKVFVISEDTPIHTVIGSVTAVDEDSGTNGIINYSIKPLNEFAVAPLTGEIYTVKLMDFETKSSYKLRVSAFNEGTDLSSSIEIFIYISQVNEYLPRFIDTNFNYNFPVCSMNNSITSLSAYDIDAGNNADNEFYIIRGFDEGIVINKKSGELKISNMNDLKPDITKTVTVLVKNSEQLSNSDLEWNSVPVNVSIKSCQCTSTLCSNHGTCVEVASSTVRCVCVEGFTGQYCETKLTACECFNEGECIDGICQCKSPYTGGKCERCSDDYCSNKGTCSVVNNVPTCTCNKNYSGLRCEISHPCSDLDCNKYGNNWTCKQTNNTSGICVCEDGFAKIDGKCVQIATATLPWWQILLIAIAFVLICCITALIIICYHRNNKKSTNAKHENLSMVAVNGGAHNHTFNSTTAIAESISTPASISKQESFASADIHEQIGVINDIVGLTADEIDLLNLGRKDSTKFKHGKLPVYDDTASVTAHSLSSDSSSKITNELMSTQVTTLSNTSSFSTQTTAGSSIAPPVRNKHLPLNEDRVLPSKIGNIKIAERIASPAFSDIKEMFEIPPELNPTRHMQPPSDTTSWNSFTDDDDVPDPMDLIMVQIRSQLRPKSTTDNATHSESSCATGLTNISAPIGFNTMTEYYASLIGRSEKLSESMSDTTDICSDASTVNLPRVSSKSTSSNQSPSSASSRHLSFSTFKRPTVATTKVIPLPIHQNQQNHEEFV